MIDDDFLADARRRAILWADAGRGDGEILVERRFAINEELLALDVLDLIGEVERLRAVLAAMAVARDTACAIASELCDDAELSAAREIGFSRRIAALRAVGRERP